MVWYGMGVVGTKESLNLFFESFIRRNLHIRASDFKQTENGLVMELFSFQRFGFSRNCDPHTAPCACVCAQMQPPPLFEASAILVDHSIAS